MADERGIGMSKRVKEEGSSSHHQAEENNQSVEENVRFLDLPENIHINILSRLPLNKIFQFKSVSKTFSKILSDPYFSEVHLTVSPKTTPALILIQDEYHVSMSVLDLDQASSATSSSSINASTSTTDLSFQNIVVAHSLSTRRNVKLCSFISYDVTTVDSCNGLVCYYHTLPELSTESTYFVCNPLLAEYIILPRPTLSTPDYDHSGFGFCTTSKTYKVIRCMSRKSVDSNMVETWTHVAEIHTLGTKSWRSIPGPHRFPESDYSFDAHLNGNLHWITYDHKNPFEIICSFDLHTEKFGVIPPPPHFERDYKKKKIFGLMIGSMKGSLCLTYVSEEDAFTVWVMNEYGVKESWTKHFSIDVMLYADLRVEDFNRPVKFSDNGDIWFLTGVDSLVSYSPETKSFKEVSQLGTELWGRVIPHVPSLVSLRNAVAVDKDVEVEGGITIQNMGPFNALVKQGSQIIESIYCVHYGKFSLSAENY